MNLVEWLESNIPDTSNYLLVAICIAIIFIVIHDFYHLLFNAIISWFRKD